MENQLGTICMGLDFHGPLRQVVDSDSELKYSSTILQLIRMDSYKL